MKRIVLLMLAAMFAAGCGQSTDTSTDNMPAAASSAPAAETPAPAPAPAAAVSTPAAAAATSQTAAPAEPAGQRIQLAQADLSAVEAAGFVEGRAYTRISPAQPTNTPPGQVEVNEFFMHSCIHCYNLEPYVEAWLPNKPDFINFVRVPTTWDEIRVLHAQAFYTAESLGITDEIMMPFFREFHDQANYLETPAKLATFFGRFGVSKEDFDSHFASFSVMTKVNNAAQLGQRYKIDSTPQIVIAGKYKTGVDRAGSPEQLFELIELLAAAERAQ
jgi:thiol:disulfide interchange protein DsbA